MKRKVHNKLICFLFVLFVVFSLLFGGVGNAYAAEFVSGYSNVIEDLRKDINFKIEDYPAIEKDYSLQVIQIAESTKGELFVYVYQPAALAVPLTATQINMSLTENFDEYDYSDNVSGENSNNNSGISHGGGGGSFRSVSETLSSTYLYDLTLLNRTGVFAKYKVTNFTVSADPVRYYNITSIFREWEKDIDASLSNDNKIKSVCFEVGKLYKLETVDGSVKYSCKNVDTVEIRNPYVDFLSYYNGVSWGSFLGLTGDKFTDVHYIAFSTDRQIDTLKETEVTYTTQSYSYNTKEKEKKYGVKSEPQYITLTGEMNGSTPDGFLASKYTWKCIQRTADFIKTTGLDKDNYAYDNVKNTEFILVFLTTQYTQKEVYSPMQGHSYDIEGTKVSDVAILRLTFETNGVTYNLGTVMSQQEGDDTPGNSSKPLGFWAYIWRCIVRLFKGTATLTEQIVAVIALFFGLLFVPILLTVLSFVFPAFGAVMKSILKGIWIGIKYLFVGLWWVIRLPFRGVAALIRKIRGG